MPLVGGGLSREREPGCCFPGIRTIPTIGLFVLFEQCLMAVFFVGVSVVTFHFISCLKERFFPMGIDIFI